TMAQVTRWAINGASAPDDWDQNIWSYDDGGTSCAPCTPTSTSEVHINSGNIVYVDGTDGDAKNVTVYSGNTLEIGGGGGGGKILRINNAGTLEIKTGGTFTASTDFHRLEFVDDPGTYSLIINDGTLTTGILTIGPNLTLNISGAGAADVLYNINLSGNDATVTNSLTGTLAVGVTGDSDLNYTGTGITFTNSGTMTIKNDIHFGSSTGSIFTNTGIVTVTGQVYMDGSSMTVNNSGTMTLSSDANNQGFTIFSGAYTGNVVNNTGGTLTFDLLDESNAGLIFNNSATVDMSGDFVDCGGAASIINNKLNGTWNWAGSTYDAALVLDCNVDGANTFDYDLGGAQPVIKPADGYHHLKLSTSGTKTVQTADLDVNGDLTISGTAVLDINANTSDITLAGNWSNATAAGLTEGTQTVTLDGTGTQTITNTSGTETLYNLTINNVGGDVTLNDVVDILSAGTVTFTDGIVTSSTGNEMQFQDGALTNGGDADSFVDGPVIKIGNDDFTFPTGDGTQLGNIGIANLTGTDTYTAEYLWSDPGDTDMEASLSHRSYLEHWTLAQSGAVTADVILHWDLMATHKIDNSADLTVAHYDNTDWDEPDATPLISFADPGYVTAEAVTTFSNKFTFGSKTGGGSVNPLPIELIDFQVELNGNYVDVFWVTLTETNNDYFTIERSIDGYNWEVVKVIPGAGNSSETLNYSTIDPDPVAGVSYYRLRQTDYDGQFAVSEAVAVSNGVATNNELQVYPNPTNNFIVVVGTNPEMERIRIHDVLGREVTDKTVITEQDAQKVISRSLPTS
ncbi:MAG: T9SS type A sorting domain-containing protein, partial [Bacteroidetes bacterium]|nr:T9SS type A sorting domain-containing protein [Bacteroidota bacterium]